MLKEMSKMTAKQMELVKSLTLAAYADGKMKASEKDAIFATMKQVLVARIQAKKAA
jgi:uncharacterized tellurite resistance protein B-like protein